MRLKPCYAPTMPRWLQIILSLVLFAAIMLALRAVLSEVLPVPIAWLSSKIGAWTGVALILTAACFAWLWAYREHRRQAQRDAADG